MLFLICLYFTYGFWLKFVNSKTKSHNRILYKIVLGEQRAKKPLTPKNLQKGPEKVGLFGAFPFPYTGGTICSLLRIILLAGFISTNESIPYNYSRTIREDDNG